jgi:hypothetical protein
MVRSTQAACEKTTPIPRSHTLRRQMGPGTRVGSTGRSRALHNHHRRDVFPDKPISIQLATSVDDLMSYRYQPSLAAAAFKRSLGPSIAIRDPTRSPKCGELSAHQILDIDSLPLVQDQQVLVGCERPDVLTKAPIKFSGSRATVWRATACTRLSMFLAR